MGELWEQKEFSLLDYVLLTFGRVFDKFEVI